MKFTLHVIQLINLLVTPFALTARSPSETTTLAELVTIFAHLLPVANDANLSLVSPYQYVAPSLVF